MHTTQRSRFPHRHAGAHRSAPAAPGPVEFVEPAHRRRRGGGHHPAADRSPETMRRLRNPFSPS